MDIVKVTLGSGKVHYAEKVEGFKTGPQCGGNKAAERYHETNAEVDCTRCVKWMAQREEWGARTAYYAGVVETQDNFGSQAQDVTETVETPTNATEQDAEVRIVRHGWDQATVTRGDLVGEMFIDDQRHWAITVAGSAPVYTGQTSVNNAVKVWLGLLDKAPGAKPVAETVETLDAILAQCTSVDWQGVGRLELMEAMGRIYQLARDARNAAETVAWPVQTKRKYETDPETGWPVFTIASARYMVSPRVDSGRYGDVAYVMYYEAGRAGRFRAWADAPTGTVQRKLWDARLAYDLGR